MACEILVPQPRIELMPLALEVQSLFNHQTSRDVPFYNFIVMDFRRLSYTLVKRWGFQVAQ